MNKVIKTFLSFLVGFFLSQPIWAQNDVKMADALYESGKIYVVVIVIAIIFVGLFLYLMGIDRKLTRLEKKHEGTA